MVTSGIVYLQEFGVQHKKRLASTLWHFVFDPMKTQIIYLQYSHWF